MDKPVRTRSKFSCALCERAERMVLEHLAEYPSGWAALLAESAPARNSIKETRPICWK